LENEAVEKSEHTPWPWQVLSTTRINGAIGGPQGEVIATVRNPLAADFGEFEELTSLRQEQGVSVMNGNARLIAAAPELLDACQSALQLITESLPATWDRQQREEAGQRVAFLLRSAIGKTQSEQE